MPWTKGTSGNPAGRPRRGLDLAAELRKAARLRTEAGQTYKAALAARIWSSAIDGNVRAMRLILEYLVGRPSIQPTAEANASIQVIIECGNNDDTPPTTP